MNVRIKYCGPCGYRRHAERLQKQIESLGGTVELVQGNFGVFKIWRDEALVFDKRQTRGILGKIGFGLLPHDDEILKMLKKTGT